MNIQHFFYSQRNTWSCLNTHANTHKLARTCINTHILAGLGGQDALGSPAGTDGLNSGGMITGRMEVRNQPGREGGRGGGGGGGRGGGTKAGRNDQSGLMAGEEM